LAGWPTIIKSNYITNRLRPFFNASPAGICSSTESIPRLGKRQRGIVAISRKHDTVPWGGETKKLPKLEKYEKRKILNGELERKRGKEDKSN
jgi:hypothetical protein